MLSWSLILYIIIVFDSVTAHSGISNDNGQETGHDIVKKDIKGDGSISGENEEDEESNTPLNANDNDDYYGYIEDQNIGDDVDQVEEHYNMAEASDFQDSIELNKLENEFEKRSLHAGDTFTPQELMPVAIKLLRKVGNQGEGRGIVSSSKSPEDLADRLFGGYFLTMKRIVYLDEKDLPGLDALQALALEGEDALNIRAVADSVTEAPMKIIDYGGQLIGVDKYPGRCHYKLIYKKVEPTPKPPVTNDMKENTKSGLRTGEKILKLEKKMRPNRHLIVKYSRKSNNGTNTNSDEDKPVERGRNKKRRRHQIKKSDKKGMNRKQKRNRKRQQMNSRVSRYKKSKLKRKQRGSKSRGKKQRLKHKNRRNSNVLGQATTTVKPKCKWRYHCRTPGDLDSCRLRTTCLDESNPKAFVDDIFVDHREDEHDESIKQFRKMLGITILDEDVEKIIEQHVLQVKPENMRGVDKIETLDEYFNNIIMAQHSRTTTPVPNPDSFESSIEKTGHVVDSDSEVQLSSNKNTSTAETQLKLSGEQQSQDDDVGDEELRAIQNKNSEKNKKTNSTSQPPDKNISSLPTISTTKP